MSCWSGPPPVRIVDCVGVHRPTLTKLASGRAIGSLHAHRQFRDDPTTGRYRAGLGRRPVHSGQWARWQLRMAWTSQLSGHDGTAAPRSIFVQPGPPYLRIVDRIGVYRPTFTKLASGRDIVGLHAPRKFRDDPTTGRYRAGLGRRPAHSGFHQCPTICEA